VRSLVKHAQEIFGVACQAGDEDSDWAILVGCDGGIHVLAGGAHDEEALRLSHGAQAAYRVTRRHGEVKLEARALGQMCRLEATAPAAALTTILRDYPQYLTIPRG
jgi:hypothetical protein